MISRISNVKYIFDTATVSEWETHCSIGLAAAKVVTLPSAALCAGKIFTFRTLSAFNATLTCVGSDVFVYPTSPTTLETNNDEAFVVLLSTGTHWVVLGSGGLV